MERDIQRKLIEWKRKYAGRYALLIEGARRVGKSYSAVQFAKAEYRSHILVDFNTAPSQVKQVFSESLHDLDHLYLELSALYGTRLYPRESLIILDEVQLFPRARAAVKPLVADGRFDILETGSLISVHKNTKDILIPSEEKTLQLFPMSFPEFLLALGRESLWTLIETAFAEEKPLSDHLHREAIGLFRQYLLVGGMPQAVDAYRAEADFQAAEDAKREILHLYRADMTKHAGRKASRVHMLFDSLPTQLKRKSKRFSPGLVKPGSRMRDYLDGLDWLFDSMIVTPCWRCTEPMPGMRLNRDSSSLRAYLGDTGLLVSQAFDESGALPQDLYARLAKDKLSADEGMLLENMVAQMLAASGHKLYYYENRDRQNAAARMGIDFLLRKRNATNRHNLLPLEVKSAKSRDTHSLDKFRRRFADQLGGEYVICRRNLEKAGSRTYLPFYMVPLLQQHGCPG